MESLDKNQLLSTQPLSNDETHRHEKVHLRSFSEKILNDWEHTIRNKIPGERAQTHSLLINSMPEMLMYLQSAIEQKEKVSPPLLRLAKNHGAQRAALAGYSLELVREEFINLRIIVLDVLREANLLTSEIEEIILNLFNQVIDISLQEYIDASRTKNEQFERIIQERSCALQEALQQRDEFLSIASHELKTPITALRLKLEILNRDLTKNPNQKINISTLRFSITSMLEQTDRITKMLRRLFDISLVRSQQTQMNIGSVDFTKTAQEVIARHCDQAALTGSHIDFTAPQEPIIAEADIMKVEQVFTNLISNAIKYGAGKPIKVSLSKQDNALEFRVRDQGIGISKADLHRIFERFERATKAREDESLGLGLFICKEIIKSHGGSIQVLSELGRGSEFIVTLPFTLNSSK